MARTNAHGWGLKRLLETVLNRDLTVPEFYEACGLTHARYYAGRTDDIDFPNAEELRNAATSLGLDYANLLVEFDLLEPLPGKLGYTAGGETGPLVVLAKGRRKTGTNVRKNPL